MYFPKEVLRFHIASTTLASRGSNRVGLTLVILAAAFAVGVLCGLTLN